MFLKCLLILSGIVAHAAAQLGKCDQTPQLAKTTPSEDSDMFSLAITNADKLDRPNEYSYSPDQTYVLQIKAYNSTRPFRWFMITAEDPAVDNSTFEWGYKNIDVGTLKSLDSLTRYSERCYSSVENVDTSEKTHVEIHWVSPKQSNQSQTIRIRGMVAETSEVWYTGSNLTVILYKDNQKQKDSPPHLPAEFCGACSEARYEVIFKGEWSRLVHPRNYPSKPDENGYTHMVGASHSYNYTLWAQGSKAGEGVRLLVEEANSTELENEIIANMAETSGTRTLIRGKRRHHPFMSQPSHALFRVDRYHHLFSIVVGLRPSPDWFLGTSKFELCTESKWLEEYSIPLYPWDAGTMDGVSYESEKSRTQTVENVERVEVGSFNEASPFYQMNLNDLKPFAHLKVRRLDVYPLVGADCSEPDDEEQNSMKVNQEDEELQDEPEEPVMAESRQSLDRSNCYLRDWGDWSPCTPDKGVCGEGFRTRTRRRDINDYFDDYQNDMYQNANNCDGDQDKQQVQYQNCFNQC